MTTGKKSRTADHPTGIKRNRTTNRVMAGGGKRGQHASWRVAVVGSMTTRNAPFAHSVSALCPGQLQRSLRVSNPCALPVVKDSGTTLPTVTLSQSCGRLQTRLDGSGGTLSQPSCIQHRASPRPKLRHPSMSWLRKSLSRTKPPRTRGSLGRDSRNRRRQLRSCGSNSKPNRISLGGLFLHYHRSRKLRNTLWMVCVPCALLCMVLAPMATKMHRDLRQRSRIRTCSSGRSGCSMNLQRGQEQNRMWTTQPSSNALTVAG